MPGCGTTRPEVLSGSIDTCAAFSRVNPLLHRFAIVVGAGLPAKRPRRQHRSLSPGGRATSPAPPRHTP
ncbi:hypothetical protein E8E68_26400 [Pseudomonas sp. BN607]|nr:hypothetical protein [Pseudomonas sp. BN607]